MGVTHAILPSIQEHLTVFCAQHKALEQERLRQVKEQTSRPRRRTPAAGPGLPPPPPEDKEPPPVDAAAAVAVSTALERWLYVLELFFCRDGRACSDDFAVVWQRRPDGRGVRRLLHWWCLNPAAGFRALSAEARAIVLTSGTLSPLDSFASELGVPFPVMLEARHVLLPNRVLARTVARGPDPALPLAVNYKSSTAAPFLDQLAAVVLVRFGARRPWAWGWSPPRV
jgi:hypothetical protein